MKDPDAHSLEDVLKQFLNRHKLRDRVNETDLEAKWEAVVGKIIANHTIKVRLRGSYIYIHLDSSVLREELVYHQTELIQRVNEFLGTPRIKEVVLV